jgi:hypothetical protein
MEKCKIKNAVVKKTANVPKRKPFKADILDSESSELLPSIELAKLHESNQRFLAAAELYETLYNRSKKEIFLQNIDRIANLAIENDKPFVAQAIFIKMSILVPGARDQANYVERAASLHQEIYTKSDLSILEESGFALEEVLEPL